MEKDTKLTNTREAIIMAMSEEMRRDPSVFLMGEDVGIYGGDFGTSVGMLEEFGKERVRDTPISENAISGCALGAAMTGMRPIVDVTFMDFCVYMMDNIVNQAAKTRYMYGGKGTIPVVFRCAAGSGVGSAAQHSQSLESWFCHIPGLKVVAPGCPRDVKGILKAAIRDNNPVVFLEYKALYNQKGEVPLDPDFVLPLGKADIKRVGNDVTVVTYGRMLERVLQAADEVKEQNGVSVEVIDLMTLIPLDKEAIVESVKKTGRVLLVNDAHKTNGFIGEVAAMIAESEAFDYLDNRIMRLAAADIPVPYNHAMETAMLPNVEKIKKTIMHLVEKR